jgi:ankyrin repeat protein
VTPLHLASIEGTLDVINDLVENGAFVNEKDESQDTPLHLACRHGHSNVIRLLVELGASLNEKDRHGWTPLHCVSFNGQVECITLLCKFGASVNGKDSMGRSALHLASRYGKLSVVDLLLELGASVNEKDNDGRSPLDVASFDYGQHNVVMPLLRHKALSTEEVFDDNTVAFFFASKQTLLAVLAYGLSQPISDKVPQWCPRSIQGAFRDACGLCALQVYSEKKRPPICRTHRRVYYLNCLAALT